MGNKKLTEEEVRRILAEYPDADLSTFDTGASNVEAIAHEEANKAFDKISKIVDYHSARMACEMAKEMLKQHNIEQLLKDINRADSVGMFTNPTLWREKHKAMDEDRAVFAAALKFIRTWPEKT